MNEPTFTPAPAPPTTQIPVYSYPQAAPRKKPKWPLVAGAIVFIVIAYFIAKPGFSGSRHSETSACSIIRGFETGNSSSSFNNDPSSQASLSAAEGTGLETPLQDWVTALDDGNGEEAVQAGDAVNADCDAAGVSIYG